MLPGIAFFIGHNNEAEIAVKFWVLMVFDLF